MDDSLPASLPGERRFPLDPEHGWLRFAMLLIFVAVWLAVFLLGQLLVVIEGSVIISIVAGFGLAALSAQRLEGPLKQRWPSGRSMSVTDKSIRLLRREEQQESLDTAQEVNVLTWRFRINRRARVPKGWSMVALALEQDDRHIPVYTFMSQDDLEALSNHGSFIALQGRRQRREGGDLRLAGEQKRLHSAEQLRWLQGGEMSREDFIACLRHLHERFPAWMPELV
ncbi:MAG: hypothetical protein OXH77_10375 [Anaerolineaceae bacterium]|nr:hypothetical protein [Anaerolineaceae bacterium]